jgi:hypothetical protein
LHWPHRKDSFLFVRKACLQRLCIATEVTRFVVTLCFIKYHTMKTYGGVEYSVHP